MEGAWRGAVAAAAAGWAVACAAAGCGDSSADATGDPVAAFAPAVQLAGDERWQPLRAEDFLRNAVLWFAEDGRCADRKIAVGKGLPEQRTERFNWMYADLGSDQTYYRTPYDRRCEYDYDREYRADEWTRPHDPDGRPRGMPLGEGYYLDVDDTARQPANGRRATYYETRRERVGGSDGLRVSYWFLFGMSESAGDGGKRTHEGDWERVDVLAKRGDGGYEPVAVVPNVDGEPRPAVKWDAIAEVDGHPSLEAASGSHELRPLGGDETCDGCDEWRTWDSAMVRARDREWYGFGGAWGDVGDDLATTGSAGPRPDTPPEGQS